MSFARFMSSMVGRAARVIAGIALVAIGVSLGGAWWILAVVGLVAIAAGVFNFCLIAPLIKAPFSGAALKRTQ